MDYLKRYISFNLFAFYGYYVLGRFVYVVTHAINNATDGFSFLVYIIGNIGYMILIALHFVLAFLCEFILLFILSKIFKKKLGLNIQNKVYDILYRLGVMFVFIPVVIPASLLIYTLNYIEPIYADSWLFMQAYLIGVIDLLIKGIFLRKYFIKNS